MKTIILCCMSIAMTGCSMPDYNYETKVTSSSPLKKEDPYEDSTFNRVKERQGGGEYNNYGSGSGKESHTMTIKVY